MIMSFFVKIEFALSEFDPEIVTTDNMRKYQNVFFSNVDYYLLTDGHHITDEDLMETVEYGETFTKGNVHSVGFQIRNSAAAFLSVIEKYPEPDTLYIGLLLVDEFYKRKHVGNRIITGVKTAAREAHYQKIKLSVLKKNESAFMFWKSLGFIVTNDIDGNLSMECSLNEKHDE